MVFSPDGKTIASASRDGTVKLWNAENRNLIDTLEGHKNSVLSVVFSPDSKTIASASTDKTVRLWNWNFDNLIPRGCNKLEDYLINSPDKLQDLKICQNQEILTAAASTLVEEGESSAENGNFEEAVEKFSQAKEWNPELDINPEAKAAIAFVGEGKKLVRDGEVKEAIAAYNKALKINPDLQISAEDWRSLCWDGSFLHKHAKDVMFACNKAVALEPENGLIRNNRGFARALIGDYKGAVEDFEVFVKWTDDDEAKSRNQRYLDDLRKGKNPFTAEWFEQRWR